MRRSWPVLVLLAVLLVLLLPTAAGAVDANTACLDCHGVSGDAPNKAVFDVPAVDTAKCNACHWYGVHDFDSLHFESYAGYMSQQCESCHHSSDTWPLRPKIVGWPTYTSPAGWFQSAESLLASAGAIHSIHVNGTWLRDKEGCASCHGVAGCDACHSAPDTTHVEHASVGLRDSAVTTVIGRKNGDVVADTYLYSYAPATNYDSSVAFFVGSPSAGREERAVIRFPLARYDMSTLATATVQLTRSTGAPFPLRAYRLRRHDVVTSQASWNVYRTGSTWGTAGAKSAATDYYGDVYAESSTGAFDVTALLQAALAAGDTSLDLLIVDPAPVARRYTGFYSSNVSYPEWYPSLMVEGYKPMNLYAYGPLGGTEVGDPESPVVLTPQRSCVAAACHDLTKAGTTAFASTCESCHTDTHHYSLHEATALGVDCKTCHQTNLQPEHYRDSSSSAMRGCANCHPTPRNGLFEPWNKGCSQAGALHLGAGCHDPRGPDAMHRKIDASHAVDPAAAACTASGCHDDGLANEHADATVTDTGGTRTGCNVCHTPYTMPSTTNCKTCHPDKVDPVTGGPTEHGFDPVKHTANDGTLAGSWPAPGDNATYNPPYAFSTKCSDCHDLLLTDQHAGGCETCHPSPRDTFATWGKTCTQAGCHTVVGTAHDTVGASHSMATSDVDAGCGFTNSVNGRRPCHYRDLVQEHNRTINERLNPATGEPTLKSLSTSCLECHESQAFKNLGGTWNGTCGACHNGTTLPNHSIVGTARYDEVYAKHNNPAGYYDNGAGARGTNAMDAHGWIQVNPDPNSPNKTIGCGTPTCHTAAYIGGGWPYYTAACAGCHGPSVAIPDPYQGDYAWYSDYWFDDQAMDSRLTMTLDPITLPANSALDFKTWYDVEKDWDYGYVQVSTDNGATWTNLRSDLTTTSNPFSQNLGNGITGSSGGWRDGHFDLSAYAGMTVRIRFAYIGDFYTYGLGWMLDVITVGPAGSPVFSDDMETARPEWDVVTTVTYYDYDLEEYVSKPTSLTGWRRFSR